MATSSEAPDPALQLAIQALRTSLQGTHASFLIDGSAPSSTHAVQPLHFPALENTFVPGGPCVLGDLDFLETQSKSQLLLHVQSLKEENTRIRNFIQGLVMDRVTVITQCSLLHIENKKLRSGLFTREQKRQTARERISPGGKAIRATADNTMALIRAIDTDKRAAATRKGGAQLIPGMSREEKARRHELWKRAESEYNERRAQLKNDGMPVKYAGKKPLLKDFLNAQDPKVLLQELRTQDQASSSPAHPRTRHQHRQIAQSDEDDEEWVDTESLNVEL